MRRWLVYWETADANGKSTELSSVYVNAFFELRRRGIQAAATRPSAYKAHFRQQKPDSFMPRRHDTVEVSMISCNSCGFP